MKGIISIKQCAFRKVAWLVLRFYFDKSISYPIIFVFDQLNNWFAFLWWLILHHSGLTTNLLRIVTKVFIHESCQKSTQLYANTEGASTETKRFFRKKSLYRGNSDLWFPLIWLTNLQFLFSDVSLNWYHSINQFISLSFWTFLSF